MATMTREKNALGAIGKFMELNFRHYNSRETVEAARAYKALIDGKGKMLLSLAGAMSTGELGISLAKMIREGKIHAISSTAANLEEDLFNLMAHDEYKTVSDYRDLTPAQEVALRDKGFNRVTDVCIPEHAMRNLERLLVLGVLKQAALKGESLFPWEAFYRLLDEGEIQKYFKSDEKHSWVLAAWEKRLPIYTPGWEDCTMANNFVARVMEGKVKSHNVIKGGTEQMQHLVEWYTETTEKSPVGFFQIGGGIAGDFAICAVPLLIQDLKKKDSPLWAYFAQIGDSTTSYGSYSGAVPNEKITWYKIAEHTPKFMIQSDATIVAPLIFSYVLGE